MTQHRTTSFSLKFYQIIVKWTLQEVCLVSLAGQVLPYFPQNTVSTQGRQLFHSSVKCFHFAVLSAIQKLLVYWALYLFLSMNCPYDKEKPRILTVHGDLVLI